MAISEAELVLPSLYLISESPEGRISTSELIPQLRKLIKPQGEDIEILLGRKDDKFSQKVRNLVSHRTLEKLGYATINNSIHKITEKGIQFLNNPFNQLYISEKFVEEFEGADTIENNKIEPFVNDDEDDDINESVNNQNNKEESVYPNASLNIERTHFSVFELKRKLKNEKLKLDPDFQRENVWSKIQKSELIESVLMNIPLPYIYLNEDKFGNLVVIDGRQRLTALFQFLDNKFRLHKELSILKNISGRKFSELKPLVQSSIEDYQLITQIIKPPTSDRVVIDIFDRVNRSGTLLNSQEIRNALYQGKVTELLKLLAESEVFKTATGSSIKSERMRDKYIILRFLAFHVWRTLYVIGKDARLKDIKYDYRSDIEDFLGRYMDFINSMSDEEIKGLVDAFQSSMTNTIKIIGEDAFRLPNLKNPNKKRPINMALFESLGYLMSHQKVVENKNAFLAIYNSLLEDKDFLDSFLSIDGSVKLRFDKMDNILNKL